MQNDAIVAEVRLVRDELARKFGYDLEKMLENLKRREKLSTAKFVSFAKATADRVAS